MKSFLNTLAEKRDIEKVNQEGFSSCRFASSCGDGVTFSEWCELADSDQLLKEKLYLGNRNCLVTILTRNDKRKLKDFAELPETAKWKIREEDGGFYPSLEDRHQVYALMPDSGKVSQMFKSLSYPDPDATGPAGFPVPRDYCEDVWFEECEDGGVYFIGIEDEVFIMYIDIPSDMLYGKYKCSIANWEATWLNTFGSLKVDISTMEKLYIEKINEEGFISCRFAASGNECGVTFSEWSDLTDSDQALKDKLYLGNRNCLVTILTRNNKRKLRDFAELPETARWKMRDIDDILVPSLEDRSQVYALMPDSGKLGQIFKTLSMPDPDATGPAGFPVPRDYCEDVWFEECEDGGVYFIGIEDEVFIMYMDVPSDMLFGKYKCSKKRWESLWLSAFKSFKVNPTLFR